MTRTEITKTINDNNTNKSIKWSILENTSTKITLTNDYDKSINYSIEVNEYDEDEMILVINNHMVSTVAGLLKGNSSWDDYSDTKQGMLKGVAIAVRNFNHIY